MEGRLVNAWRDGNPHAAQASPHFPRPGRPRPPALQPPGLTP
ncbi:Hypothetical protein CAP_8499 [Chondromyces apiculatus DSM 436]|uniref:Uncharacterized protein n=1 Tax=Chondromyces apiculatus DSM 436 TaxID=1192034 RepID=A0A017SY68_9BACT|nr:Hypothetical protein CAP_8499 [Chondromyces apiculatus DSM 436]